MIATEDVAEEIDRFPLGADIGEGVVDSGRFGGLTCDGNGQIREEGEGIGMGRDLLFVKGLEFRCGREFGIKFGFRILFVGRGTRSAVRRHLFTEGEAVYWSMTDVPDTMTEKEETEMGEAIDQKRDLLFMLCGTGKT